MKNLKFLVFLPIFFLPLFAFPVSCNSLGSNAGIFASYDAGQNWQQKGKIGKKENLDDKEIYSLKFDPKNALVIYAGTKEKGLFKTSDGGDLWYQITDQSLPKMEKMTVQDVAIDGRDNNWVYVAAFAENYGWVLRSQNGGSNWEEVFKTAQKNTKVTALAVSQSGSGVFMGTEEGGLFFSLDHGVNWRALRWFESGVVDVTVDTLNSRIIYASTLRSGIFKSVDGGETWATLDFNANGWLGESTVFKLLSFSPGSGTILAASEKGLLKSQDNGATWQKMEIVVPPNSLPILSVAAHPQRANQYYYAAGSVVYKTIDGGVSWSVHPLGTTGNVGSIEINPFYPDNILAGIKK